MLDRATLVRLGVDRHAVARQVHQGRWQVAGPTGVVLHNGTLTRAQLLRLAVLDAGPQSALAAWSALELLGLVGWHRETIHVVLPRGLTAAYRHPSVHVHESRRFDPVTDLHPSRAPRTTRPARAAIDAAAWSRDPRSAVGVLAAVVQQRLTTPDELDVELHGAGKVRHHRLLGWSIQDIAGGAHALSEIDFGQLCLAFGLPRPGRRVRRRDSRGRVRYLDAEWRRPDGRIVVAEVDGAAHLVPQQYWDDMARDNDLVLDGRIVLRFAAFAVRSEPRRVAEHVARALGVPLVLPLRRPRRPA